MGKSSNGIGDDIAIVILLTFLTPILPYVALVCFIVWLARNKPALFGLFLILVVIGLVGNLVESAPHGNTGSDELMFATIDFIVDNFGDFFVAYQPWLIAFFIVGPAIGIVYSVVKGSTAHRSTSKTKTRPDQDLSVWPYIP